MMTTGDASGPEAASTDDAEPRSSRRWAILLIAGAVIVVAPLVALGAHRTGIRRVTPLSPDHAPFAYPGQDSVSAPAPVGVPLSFGSLVLSNPSDEPITITAVEVLQAEDGLTVLGVKLDASQDRHAEAIGSQAGFPAPNPGSAYQDVPVVVEAAGAAPRGVDLVVGLQATRPGRWRARDLRVSYRRGGRDYVTTYRNTWVVCTDMTVHCDNDPQTPDA